MSIRPRLQTGICMGGGGGGLGRRLSENIHSRSRVYKYYRLRSTAITHNATASSFVGEDYQFS